MANVFANLIRPVPTVLDYMGQMEELDRSTLLRQQAMQQMQERTRALQQAEQERNALTGLIRQSGGDQNKLIGLLESSGVPSFYAQAQGYRKAGLEARKVETDIAKDAATAARTTQQTSQANRSDALASLQMLNTPQDAQASLSAAVTAGKLPMQEATRILQSIPQDPQAFAQWKQQMMLAAASPDKAAEITFKDGSTADWKDYQKAVSQGYRGQFIDYQREMANLKAPKTRVEVNTDNLGLKPKDRFEMEGRLADDYKGVTKLDNLVLSATSKIKTALSQPGAIKDQAAIYSFAKMLDPDGAVREADYAAISNTAGLGDRILSYINRLRTGEQLTQTQRQEMLQMMTAFEEVANRRIAAAQADFGEQAARYNLRPESVFSGSRTGGKPAQPKPDATAAPAGAAPAGAAPRVIDFSALPGG